MSFFRLKQSLYSFRYWFEKLTSYIVYFLSIANNSVAFFAVVTFPVRASSIDFASPAHGIKLGSPQNLTKTAREKYFFSKQLPKLVKYYF